LKIAILGASGIGKFHAKIFNKFDVEIISILSSSKTSGEATSRNLNETLGLNLHFFVDLELLISESKPDAVVISTPNEMHYEQIMYLLDNRIPIFCEKPLFWNWGDNYLTFSKKLLSIKEHPYRVIFVNTSSAHYISSIRSHLPLLKDIKTFSFKFSTQGNKTYKQIAEDLLPHGLSLLIELFGCNQIKKYNEEISKFSFKCNFIYSDCIVNFEFNVGIHLEKVFMFLINEDKYIRKQKEGFNEYKVYLELVNQKNKIKIDDPFEIYARRFVDFCLENNSKSDDFFEISHNLTLMAKILLNKKLL
jgi:hypothetical protein